MKIALISDTHDNTPAIVWIIEYLNEQGIELALHAGDMINPGILRRFFDHYQGHLHFIFGNNDGEELLAERRSHDSGKATCHKFHLDQEFEGKKFFMHHYSEVAEQVAQSGNYDVVIGGHDHQFRITQYGETVFINPGNTVTKDKWLQQDCEQESSFVVLDLETMKPEKIVVPH